MNLNLNGIILKMKPFKEKDALVTILSKEKGIETYLIKGIYTIRSKQFQKVSLFNIYEFTVSNKKSLNQIIDAVSKVHFVNISCSFEKALYLQIMNSLVIHSNGLICFSEYEPFLKTLSDETNLNLILSLLLSLFLKKLGLQPQINQTVDTFTSLVNGFSISQGGFIEKSENHLPLSRDELIKIRLIFKANIENFDTIREVEISDKIKNLVFDYFEFHSDIKINGRELI